MDSITAYNYIRSRFVCLRETRNLIKKHGLKIKYGFLSEEESNRVSEIIEKFLKERNLTKNDFKRHLVEDTEFPIHDLIYECTEACELRTYKSMHTHITYIYHPYIHTNWNEEEEMQLLDLVNQKGFKWKEISYHISKYKDICRLKYLRLKGEATVSLGKTMIQGLLECMPVTDDEWTELCSKLHLNKTTIQRSINKYLNGKELKKSENKIMDIQLCLQILNNNHYCKFNTDIDQVLAYLNSEPGTFNLFEKIDGGTTPFISKKGKRAGSVLVDGIFHRNDQKPAIGEVKYPEDAFEALLDSVKQATSQNSSQAKFLNRFLDFFKLKKDFKLDIEINKNDIFWSNVTRNMTLDKSSAVAKFNQLSTMYSWKMFRDIYDTVVKLSYDFVISQIKKNLVKGEEETKINIGTEESVDTNPIK